MTLVIVFQSYSITMNAMTEKFPHFALSNLSEMIRIKLMGSVIKIHTHFS